MEKSSREGYLILTTELEMDECNEAAWELAEELSESELDSLPDFDKEPPLEIGFDIAAIVMGGLELELNRPQLAQDARERAQKVYDDFAALGIKPNHTT